MNRCTNSLAAKLTFIAILLSLPAISFAEFDIPTPENTIQECLLEGEIVPEQEGDDENTVRVDFYKAERFDAKRPCLIDNRLEFTQPKGTIIEHLSVGSIVVFRYIRTSDNQEEWLLVGAFI